MKRQVSISILTALASLWLMAEATAVVFTLKPGAAAAAGNIVEKLRAKITLEEKVNINGGAGSFTLATTTMAFGDALQSLGADIQPGRFRTGSNAILFEVDGPAGRRERFYILSPAPEAQTLVFRMVLPAVTDTPRDKTATWPDALPQPTPAEPDLVLRFPGRDTFFASWRTVESPVSTQERYARALQAAGWQPSVAAGAGNGRPPPVDPGLYLHPGHHLAVQFYATASDDGTYATLFMTSLGSLPEK